jgi:hypothetical protein
MSAPLKSLHSTVVSRPSGLNEIAGAGSVRDEKIGSDENGSIENDLIH